MSEVKDNLITIYEHLKSMAFPARPLMSEYLSRSKEFTAEDSDVEDIFLPKVDSSGVPYSLWGIIPIDREKEIGVYFRKISSCKNTILRNSKFKKEHLHSSGCKPMVVYMWEQSAREYGWDVKGYVGMVSSG